MYNPFDEKQNIERVKDLMNEESKQDEDWLYYSNDVTEGVMYTPGKSEQEAEIAKQVHAAIEGVLDTIATIGFATEEQRSLLEAKIKEIRARIGVGE